TCTAPRAPFSCRGRNAWKRSSSRWVAFSSTEMGWLPSSVTGASIRAVNEGPVERASTVAFARACSRRPSSDRAIARGFRAGQAPVAAAPLGRVGRWPGGGAGGGGGGAPGGGRRGGPPGGVGRRPRPGPPPRQRHAERAAAPVDARLHVQLLRPTVAER